MFARMDAEWLDLIATLLEAPPPELPARDLAVRLCATFDLNGCSYNDLDAAAGRWRMGLWPEAGWPAGTRSDVVAWSVERAEVAHPVLRHYLRTGHRIPAQSDDVPFDVGRDIRGEWADFGRSTACPHHLALPLRLGPGAHRAFVLGRPQRFSAPELARATVLWRLLTALDQQIGAAARVPACPVADDLRITARQRAVLGLLADGLTAAAIARKLGIGERTVHKHLEHLYARLGVSDRLTAVMRARDLGLLPGRALSSASPGG